MATTVSVQPTSRPANVDRSLRDRIRICHVSMTLLTGGLERLLVEIGRHCNSDQFELQFVALDRIGQPAEDLRSLGWKVSSLTTDGPQSKLLRAKRLFELLQSDGIDVVHSHNTLAHFYATTAAKWAGVPVVINTQHGRGCGASWKAKWQFRLANQFADQIVGVSEDATRLCQADDPMSARRMKPIWNGIDLGRFAFRGPADAAAAISVARLSPEKDFATLLRATRLVVREVPEFRVRIVGDGRERAALEQLARELELEKHVEFLGERHDVPCLLAEAGFFVSSSLSEGISLTLLEAMAVGLPIVATDVGGNPEIIESGRSGRLVQSGSPEMLAAAMLQMLADRDAWRTYGEFGRQRVERHFNIRHMVQQYEAMYCELLEAKRRRPKS
jgi:glycosyltransferase involved in cell wall biosynthesis